MDYAGVATSSSGAATANWNFTGLIANQYYKVETTWPPQANRTTSAPYTISGQGLPLSDLVDQQLAPVGVSADNWTWQELGVCEATTNGTLTVSLSNNNVSTGSYVIADAVRLEPVPSSGPAVMVQVATGAGSQVVLPTLSSTVLDDREASGRSVLAPRRKRRLRCSMAAAGR